MRAHLTLLALLSSVLALPAAAADLAAGKARAEAVCAACHGANGASVGNHIPHLAGQRQAYLEAQMRALKTGTRKHEVMNAIAAQLGTEEIADVAAYFASLQPAAPGAKSALLPALERSGVRFPEGFRDTFRRYHVQNFPATKVVRHFYANPVAWQAAREGRALPDGAMLLIEAYAAKLGADDKPLLDVDGHFVPDRLLAYSTMAREAGWGDAVPAMLRNENWNYALFSPTKQPRAGVNQAECLACHKPLAQRSFAFTWEPLLAAAKGR